MIALTSVLPTEVLGAIATDLGNGLESVGGGGAAAAAMLGTIGASVMCAAGREESLGDGAQLLLRTVMLIDGYISVRHGQYQQQAVDEEEVVEDTKLVLALLKTVQNVGEERPFVLVGLDNCNEVLACVIRMSLRQLIAATEVPQGLYILDFLNWVIRATGGNGGRSAKGGGRRSAAKERDGFSPSGRSRKEGGGVRGALANAEVAVDAAGLEALTGALGVIMRGDGEDGLGCVGSDIIQGLIMAGCHGMPQMIKDIGKVRMGALKYDVWWRVERVWWCYLLLKLLLSQYGRACMCDGCFLCFLLLWLELITVHCSLVMQTCHALWVMAGGYQDNVVDTVFGQWFCNAIMPAEFVPISAMNSEVC